MFKGFKPSVLSVGIIGASHFGVGVAHELTSLGHEVLIMDMNESALAPMKTFCHTIIGNAENVEFLVQSGFKNLDAVIVAIDDQETYTNIATMNCKDLDLFVVARAIHAGHGKILERLGADLVVTPEYDAGLRIARLLAQPSILDMIELYEEVFMMELQAGGQLINRSLSDLNLPLRYGVQIVLIQRDLRTIFPVTAADIIKQGDKLICIGSSDNLNMVAKMCQ